MAVKISPSLLAADFINLKDELESLKENNTDMLHFDIMDDMACVRPEYDSSLNCMTAKVSEILIYRNRFLDMDKLGEIMEYLQENGTISVQQAKTKFDVKDPAYLFERIILSEMATVDSCANNGKPVRIKKL